MEKIDIPQIYSEINDAMRNEDHEAVNQLADRILKSSPKEKEAFQCKIIALINLSKNEEIITLIEKSSLEKDYLLEYAYALHEKKRYTDSIKILMAHSKTRSEIQSSISELLAQNYYKMGDFSQSYKQYSLIVQEKITGNSTDLEEDKDLISNFLAAYGLSEAKEEKMLETVTKYLNTWESFYNYCIIYIKQGKFNESLETLYRLKKDFPQLDDEFNEFKNVNLNLSIVQTAFEGFDYSKQTNIVQDYDNFFSKNKYPELFPYFYNNFIHAKKDRDSIHETLKKIDTMLKNENLFESEKYKILLNKITILLRANRINEAQELFHTITVNYEDPLYILVHCYIYYKNEKFDKLEEHVKNDSRIKNKPEAYLIVMQIMLSSISSKTMEAFHFKVINFIKEFFEFSLNYHFINFFVGFYESRHLKDYLKDFIRNFKDPVQFHKQIRKQFLKKCLNLVAKSLYSVGMYEESSVFYLYLIENIDRNDKETMLNLVNTISYVNAVKSEEYRKQIDETMVDLSPDNIASLLNEVFAKFKKNQNEKQKTKKPKKKKIKYPKNFDPKKPGPKPDPERWLPKLQRKKFKNIAKNKMAYQGANTDNTTTTSHFGKK
jgi:signal recognition particle subunit SRP72